MIPNLATEPQQLMAETPEAVVESLGKQVANLAEQVRQLAEQYARDRQTHTEWARLFDEHSKHVGKLTDSYKTLTEDLTELFP